MQKLLVRVVAISHVQFEGEDTLSIDLLPLLDNETGKWDGEALATIKLQRVSLADGKRFEILKDYEVSFKEAPNA